MYAGMKELQRQKFREWVFSSAQQDQTDIRTEKSREFVKDNLLTPMCSLEKRVDDAEVVPYLLEHQRGHFKKVRDTLVSKGVAMDLSDTGTGKTYIALACMVSMGLTARDVFVVTRKSAMGEWMRAMAHFDYKVYLDKYSLMTHEKFARRFYVARPKEKGQHYTKLTEHMRHRDVKLIIVDECHKIRKRQNQLTCVVLQLRKKYALNILMSSATLIETPDQFNAYSQVLCGDKFPFTHWYNNLTMQGRTMTINERRYGRDHKTTLRMFKSKQEYFACKKAPEYDSMRMKYLLKPFTSRMSMMDLPNQGKIFEFKLYEWPEVAERVRVLMQSHATQIADIRSKYEEEGRLRATREDIEVKYMRACNKINKGLITEQEFNEVKHAYNKFRAENETWVRRRIFSEERVAEMKERQDLERCRLEDLSKEVVRYLDEGKSVIVFCQFTESVNIFKNMVRVNLSHTEYVVESIIGGTSKKERERVVNAFQENRVNLLVATLPSMSEGVSLHDTTGDAPRVAFMCPTYNAKDFKQGMGRIWRANGKSVAHVIAVYIADTKEQEQVLNYKTKLGSMDVFNEAEYNTLSSVPAYKEEKRVCQQILS